MNMCALQFQKKGQYKTLTRLLCSWLVVHHSVLLNCTAATKNKCVSALSICQLSQRHLFLCPLQRIGNTLWYVFLSWVDLTIFIRHDDHSSAHVGVKVTSKLVKRPILSRAGSKVLGMVHNFGSVWNISAKIGMDCHELLYKHSSH